jgi:hypothetical protein
MRVDTLNVLTTKRVSIGEVILATSSTLSYIGGVRSRGRDKRIKKSELVSRDGSFPVRRGVPIGKGE